MNFEVIEGGGESPSRMTSLFRLIMRLSTAIFKTNNPEEKRAMKETRRDLNNLK